MLSLEQVADLNTVRDDLIALWHEERRLRLLLEQEAARRQELEKQLEEHKKHNDEREALLERLRALENKLKARGSKKGKDGKPSKNRSERKGRHGVNGKPEGAEQPSEKTAHLGHGPAEQPHLPTQDVAPHDLDEADRCCPECGEQLAEDVGNDLLSELIDVFERKFVLQKHKQKRYGCGRCGHKETALGPELLVPHGRYSVSFAVEVAHDKYVLHMPLERQAREMVRQGLQIDSQTLWDQLWALSRLCVPAYEALHKQVLSGRWVAADETTWPMMRTHYTPKEVEPGDWHAWIAHNEQAVFYDILPKRDQKAAKELLSLPERDATGAVVLGEDGEPVRTSYEGLVLCDGWWAYKYFAKDHRNVLLVHCWAHARREVIACEKSFPKEAGELIGMMAEMYALEYTTPPGPEHDDARFEMRQSKTGEVLERIVGWVFANALQVPPGSDLRKAIEYMVNHWEGLTRFVEYPELPLDNNAVERDARQPVQGRKNHYGSRSLRGAEVASIFYSLMQSAKLCGIEPKTYLKLAALRQLRGRSVVLPHQVTAEHLREELALSEAEIERALLGRVRRQRLAAVQVVTQQGQST